MSTMSTSDQSMMSNGVKLKAYMVLSFVTHTAPLSPRFIFLLSSSTLLISSLYVNSASCKALKRKYVPVCSGILLDVLNRHLPSLSTTYTMPRPEYDLSLSASIKVSKSYSDTINSNSVSSVLTLSMGIAKRILSSPVTF